MSGFSCELNIATDDTQLTIQTVLGFQCSQFHVITFLIKKKTKLAPMDRRLLNSSATFRNKIHRPIQHPSEEQT